MSILFSERKSLIYNIAFKNDFSEKQKKLTERKIYNIFCWIIFCTYIWIEYREAEWDQITDSPPSYNNIIHILLFLFFVIPISEDEDKHHPKQRRFLHPIVLNVDVRDCPCPLSTQIVPSLVAPSTSLGAESWVLSMSGGLLLSCGQDLRTTFATSCWATSVGGRR